MRGEVGEHDAASEEHRSVMGGIRRLGSRVAVDHRLRRIDRPQPGQVIGSVTGMLGGAWFFQRRRSMSDPGMSTYSVIGKVSAQQRTSSRQISADMPFRYRSAAQQSVADQTGGASPLTRPYVQLSEWQVRRVGATEHHRLYLKCSREVADQVEHTLKGALRPRIKLPRDDWDEWTHRYPLVRQLTADETEFLDALQRVLTLHLGPPISVAVALGHYQDPSSHDDPMHWRKTTIGKLVHDGKYLGTDSSLHELAREMASFTTKHGDLRVCDLVVAVPSHSQHRFSERLGTAVAELLRLPALEVKDDIRAPIKETEPEQRPTPTFTFDRPSVSGRRVLLVDDIVRGGGSVLALARDLHGAGASSICVLAGARTMRN